MSSRSWGLLLTGGILLLAGIVGTGLTYMRNKGWQLADGRVTLNDVTRFETSSGAMFRPSVTFRYVVDGRPFSAPYSFKVAFRNQQEARDFVNTYSPQSVHSILYDARNKYRMVLDRDELGRQLRWPVALLALGTVVSAVAVIQALRMNRIVCPKCAEPVQPWDKFCWRCAAKLPRQRKRVHKLIS